MAASDFSKALTAKLTFDIPPDVVEWGERVIDAELQEVREVLPLLATKCYASFKNEFCWCHRPTRATRPGGIT